jgi:UDP-N-acetylmuramoyl-L-alanyl-D-glutamate--2,6-diaminopimelate ligase
MELTCVASTKKDLQWRSIHLNKTTQQKPTLAQLMKGFPYQNVLGSMEKEIQSVAFDSRQVEAGSLFIAIPGDKVDGSRFISDALNRGATAVITQVPLDPLSSFGSSDVTVIKVEDCRHALSWVSAQFYQHPSKRLNLIGITGTNGKTTLTYILESLFNLTGAKTGVMGTINCRYGDVVLPAAMTTPESLEINRTLNEMVAKEVDHCFLEVSSHALMQKRVHGMHFSVAVFTNLSRDHLDFHVSMENYKKAKMALFRDNQVEKGVVNIDDFVGKEISEELDIELLTTAINNPADVRAEDCTLSANGTEFTLKTPIGNCQIRSHLLGQHNIYNLISAAAIGLHSGLSLEQIAAGLNSIENIPGRFERIDCGQSFPVLVDYAHTDDALRNALQGCRALVQEKLIVVFGCGGDRDRGKRKTMCQAAFADSDFVIITSDNPRSEDADQIIADVLEGLPTNAERDRDYVVLSDRQQAIEYAIDCASEGDLVLIAGKGHEDYQILNSGTVPFDDRQVASDSLKKRLNRD